MQLLQTDMKALDDELTEARRIFVEELLDVFDVVEVGGRPSMGGLKGTKGEWMIGGLVLPVPGDMTRTYFIPSLRLYVSYLNLLGYPPEHINAAITHTLHFISLLTFYLGIKLPFDVTWSEEAVGVGTPFIVAGKGPDTGSWARLVSRILKYSSPNRFADGLQSNHYIFFQQLPHNLPPLSAHLPRNHPPHLVKHLQS